MIKITLTIILTFLINFSVSGQNKETVIKNIRKEFLTINQTTNYSVVTLNNQEFMEQMTDGGGLLRGYFKNDNLYKIYQSVGLSSYIQTTEFYFWNKQLIFVFEKEDDYPYSDSLATFDYTKTETVFEGRYYFYKDKLIETKIKGQKRIPDKVTPQIKQTQLLKMAKYDKELLIKKKNKKTAANTGS